MHPKRTTREIPLTRGHVAIVDEDDYEWLSQFKWYARESDTQVYAARMIVQDGKRKALRMHRAIMGVNDDQIVDHINRNGLDNRRANLRIATPQQNRWNTGYRRREKDANYFPQGVRKGKHKGYSVKFAIHGFETVEDAQRAYEEIMQKLRGEYYCPPD